MALLNLQFTNFSIAQDLQTQFLTDAKPTAIPSDCVCFDSGGNDLLAMGTDPWGRTLFSDLTSGEYGDANTGGYVMAFDKEQLLLFLNQHYTGITDVPTYSQNLLQRRCQLPCGSNTADESNTNDASALAEAFLTARSNGWITPV